MADQNLDILDKMCQIYRDDDLHHANSHRGGHGVHVRGDLRREDNRHDDVHDDLTKCKKCLIF